MRATCRVAATLLAGLALAALTGCGGPQQDAGASRPALRPVPLPDVSKIDTEAQRKLVEQHTALEALATDRTQTSETLADAYGEMGRLLMAAQFDDAAETCFLNAVDLAPTEGKWSYYLAHVYRRRGSLSQAISYFERSSTTDPADLVAAWWLGTTLLDDGRLEDAARQFSAILAKEPQSVMATYGLGRAELARNDYAAAAKHLEEVLAINPRITAAHYPLGLAYRGLGRERDAQAELAKRVVATVTPTDPRMDDLHLLLETETAYQSAAVRASQAGRWADAAALFRKAVEQAPSDPRVKVNLASALVQLGNPTEAMEQLDQALDLAPEDAQAHSLLGTVMANTGREREAIESYSAAVRIAPDLIAARLNLAFALQRTGRFADALPQYQRVLEVDPSNDNGLFWGAMTMMRLHRYREARDGFEAGMQIHADQPRFAHALARLLAAAPVEGLRDGQRAVVLARQLLDANATVEVAEALAMALAETGDFTEAVAWQEQVLEAARSGNDRDLTRRLAANLALYKRRQPCRIPWDDRDPIYRPQPIA